MFLGVCEVEGCMADLRLESEHALLSDPIFYGRSLGLSLEEWGSKCGVFLFVSTFCCCFLSCIFMFVSYHFSVLSFLLGVLVQSEHHSYTLPRPCLTAVFDIPLPSACLPLQLAWGCSPGICSSQHI